MMTGYRLALLDGDEAPRVRQFCLATIAEAFGHGYHPEWHNDLDRLGSAHDDDYATERGGAFLVAWRGGEVVGCGGLRSLVTRPNLCERFAGRYPDPGTVGSLWRIYVAPTHRGGGLGCLLATRLEAIGASVGYRTSYLHTSTLRQPTVAFWTKRGYLAFDHDDAPEDATLHMDKHLPVRH
ncbi:MAG: GNAT family N-acetyltransferase [Acidimicrobiales bacterium]